MPIQEHRALVQRHADFVNTGDNRIADELFADDYVMHAAAGDQHGREPQKRGVSNLRTAFPDWRVTADEVYSDGDTVIYRWTARGTHHGPYQSEALGRSVPRAATRSPIAGCTSSVLRAGGSWRAGRSRTRSDSCSRLAVFRATGNRQKLWY